MKILVCIPALYGAQELSECLSQVVHHPQVTTIVLDNGADADVKELLQRYERGHGITVWHNPQNEYVNRPWCKFIEHFLTQSDADYLILMNSDLLLNVSWLEVVINRWEVSPQEIIIPRIVDNKPLMYEPVNTSFKMAEVPTCCTPGVFITLNRKQAEIVYPIEPVDMKVWFGDEFIYSTLRQLGYKTYIPENLLAYHPGSYTVQRVANISAIIENDKRLWEAEAKYRVQERVEKFRVQ